MHTAHHTRDAHLLRILAADGESSVRANAARNPDTEDDVLMTLASDEDFSVCQALTRNPNIYSIPELLAILMGCVPGVVSGLARHTGSPAVLAALAVNSGYVPGYEIAGNPATTSDTLLIISRRQHPEHEFDMVMEALASRDCAPEVLDTIGRLEISRRAALSLIQNAATPVETIEFIANSVLWNEGNSDIGHLAQKSLAPDVSSEKLIERKFELGPEGTVTYDAGGDYCVTVHFQLGVLAAHEITISVDNQGAPGGAADGSLVERDQATRRVKFRFEDGLEDFLVANWRDIDLFADYDFVDQQYKTDTGIIDILALSKDKSHWLIIELKRDKASDVVVGQILRYMGWVERALAAPDQRVTGLIIGDHDDQRLRDALKFTREGSVSYRSYRLKIDFE
ncbi:Leucine rich repeat variant [Cryobacterium luteum]|nr:endonuclease NucS domain-containing protein [Cryobacterium luteum]SEO12366.1 Leucine rich repeat variant [Cryobacterium luteum]